MAGNGNDGVATRGIRRRKMFCAGMLGHFFAVAVGLIAAVMVAGCGDDSAVTAPAQKPIVACSVFAYYDAARAIAAGTVDVRILLKPQQSPHEYTGVPSDKILASKAALYIKNGMGLDDHFDKLFSESSAKILEIGSTIPKDMILTTAEVSLSTQESVDPVKAPATATAPAITTAPAVTPLNVPLPNPHIWLDPLVQNEAALQIRDALIALTPRNKTIYELNAKTYMTDISRLHQDFQEAAFNFKTKEFIGFHSAYDYLAHRYGLRQIASIEELPGSGLSPAQLAKIIKLITDHKIRYIAIESGLAPQGIDKIQSETGVHTILLQPLETYDSISDSYVSLMRKNLESLKTALGG